LLEKEIRKQIKPSQAKNTLAFGDKVACERVIAPDSRKDDVFDEADGEDEPRIAVRDTYVQNIKVGVKPIPEFLTLQS
jgi:hypothetical protein